MSLGHVFMVLLYFCFVLFFSQACLKDLLRKLEAEHSNQTSEHIERILFIYHTLVQHKKGAKITKPQSVCEVHVYGFVCSVLDYPVSIAKL